MRMPLGSAFALFGLAVIILLAVLNPAFAERPSVRAPVATTITLCALMSGYLLLRAFRRPRQLSDLVLVIAVLVLALVDTEFLLAPTIAGTGGHGAWDAVVDVGNASVGFLLAAHAILLVVAFRRDEQVRLDLQRSAVNEERLRIARDLHDGLAQDLAFIAAFGQQLVGELGPEHPVIVAAHRALAVSRGVIVDLSASDAPTTAAALRRVADELQDRFGVDVDVRIESDGRSGTAELDAAVREEVVRIAREAVVNAVRHGGARRIEVKLHARGPVVLRVSDDGCGIGPKSIEPKIGFGLPTMDARAEAIGGRLVALPNSSGGTLVAVTVR
jgi:signal transduction histidine kinase